MSVILVQMCRRLVLAALVVSLSSLGGCANLMKPDPYAVSRGQFAAGPGGVTEVRCADKPATGPSAGFRTWRNKITARFARPDHRGIDLIATTDGPQVLAGKIGYGVLDKGLANEPVELYACMAGAWQPIATTQTHGSGRFAYALEGGARLPPGLRDMYASVVADRTGVRFLAYVAPTSARVIVTDVDGTLTHSESAFIGDVIGGLHVGAQANAAAALTEAAARGYQIIYLTARGDRFTDETRYWLGMNGFPRGPLRLVPSLFVMPGAATVAYKKRVLSELSVFDLVAGVGNRTSDIAAYTAAGIPPDRIFVKLPEYNGELKNALSSGKAIGFGAYTRLPLSAP